MFINMTPLTLKIDFADKSFNESISCAIYVWEKGSNLNKKDRDIKLPPQFLLLTELQLATLKKAVLRKAALKEKKTQQFFYSSKNSAARNNRKTHSFCLILNTESLKRAPFYNCFFNADFTFFVVYFFNILCNIFYAFKANRYGVVTILNSNRSYC